VLILSRGGLGLWVVFLGVGGLAAPAGHAAWTGLVCSTLWRTRARPPGRRRWAPVALVFCGAVLLHAAWDQTDSTGVRAVVALVSLALLAAQLRVAARRRGAHRPLMNASEHRAA
jgi:protease PrsW